ncbi:MAG: DUF4388 domain-containing protein [Proteobacteria bacterium]|nr:DUF4388 domain-containing protein [Pseudomonadota bacterium]MCP4918100.1 DUF4388 domain-containing protein [Pseudomonadota bacterium]
MSRPPIGEIMVELGLLSPAHVQEVLGILRERERGRFGELAIELSFVDEEGLARSVARQYGLATMDAETVAHLGIPREVLQLLPLDFMRDRLMVPMFLDEEQGRLSLVIADPTDLPSQNLAQDYAHARDLRLFVATRTAIGRLLDRLMPRLVRNETDDVMVSGPRFHQPLLTSRPVVFEPDPVRVSVLRRLEVLEGGHTEYVRDPDQVTAMLDAGSAHAVIHRDALSGQVEAFVGVWRRSRPGLGVYSVPTLSPGALPELGGGGGALADLLDKLVLESATQEVRDRVDMAELLCEAAALAPDHATDVRLCAMLLVRGEHEASRLLHAQPNALSLLDRLHTRERAATPGEDLPVECLFSTMHAASEDAAHHQELLSTVRRGERRRLLLLALEAGSDIHGRVSEVSLPELLRRTLALKRSVRVLITGEARQGTIHIDQGHIVAAEYADQSGTAAVHALARMPTASFELVDAELVERSIDEDTESLIDELPF